MNQQAFARDRRVGRVLVGSWLGSALAFLAVIVPKCPLCVAAYLCLFGVSASGARAVVQLGLPLCLALIGGSTVATALFVARRGRHAVSREKSGDSCCGTAR
jgi:predicted transporter